MSSLKASFSLQVSEFAIYFSPRLVEASFDFNLADQPMPAWWPPNVQLRRDRALSPPSGEAKHGASSKPRDPRTTRYVHGRPIEEVRRGR